MKGSACERALNVYHLILAPTHACNLRCKHCYLPDHHHHLMPLDVVLRIAEEWAAIVERERGSFGGFFHLKGGEPLILPYLIDVLDWLAARGTLRFMMTTNGTMLECALLDTFCRLNEALQGNVIIIVSLDGSCEEVHSELRGPQQFARSEEFARRLLDASLNVHFNYVVHAGNLSDVTRFVQYAENIGATQVNFLPFVPKGYGEELGEAARPDLRVLHETLAGLYRDGSPARKRLLEGNYAHILDRERAGFATSNECVAGYKGLLYVTPEGDAYACPNLVSSGLSLGNVLKEPLQSINGRRLPALYRSRINKGDEDDRYMCRGERGDLRAEPTRRPGGSLIGLPVLGQTTPSDGYSIPLRGLQEELVGTGNATREDGVGASYCFSRNF